MTLLGICVILICADNSLPPFIVHFVYWYSPKNVKTSLVVYYIVMYMQAVKLKIEYFCDSTDWYMTT